jgi:hypothetical protein
MDQVNQMDKIADKVKITQRNFQAKILTVCSGVSN